MCKIIVPANLDKLGSVLDFICEWLETLGCSMKVQLQIAIAVEEIYVNIAHYAYVPNEGEVEIACDFDNSARSVSIIFADRGIPYNPMSQADPDTTLSAEDRDVGGLGIYMVKKSMDKVIYEYKDNKNILMISKKLSNNCNNII